MNVMYNMYVCYIVYYNEIATVRCQGTLGGKRHWVKCEQLSLGL
jgi:hypothetical protein